MALKREDVAENRKWDLSSLFKSEKDYDDLSVKVAEKLKEISAYEGKLDENNALACLRLSSEIGRALERLYVYANLIKDENTADPVAQARAEKIGILAAKCSSATSFIGAELAKFPVKTLRRMAENKEFEAFSVMLNDVIREKKHILSAKEEKIMSEISAFTGDFRNIFMMFDNADIKFGKVCVDGEDVELTHGAYSVLLQNPSQEVRKKAFETYYASYRASLNTVAATYAGSVKKDCTMSALRGFPSALARALYADDIKDSVYGNLISAVHGATPAVHDYIRYRKKALGLKELHMYDLYVPITDDYRLEMEYDDAYALVEDALAPLGAEYRELLERARAERWIDVEETVNKRSGAYSWGMYDSNPYVLLNYRKTAHDVFTIAHELGHSMHSHYSRTSQCYEKSDYSIFVAEIASTVNEVLLLKYLISKADGKARKYLLSYYLDMFRTTVFRQTMFAEFEKFAHELYEAGSPLTAENMSAEYMRLNKFYYGDGVISDDDIAIEWARIPHFYNAFYVYKYATGMISAVNIAWKLLNEKGYVDKYKAFLSAGGSLYPLPTLALAEVDLRKKAPFAFAMREFKDALKEMKKL